MVPFEFPRSRPVEFPVLLVDGVCNLCSGAVRFVADHERAPHLRFASLQSVVGRRLLRENGIDPDVLASLVLVDAAGAHLRSDAALRLAGELRAPWSWLRHFRIVPRPLRDAVYDFVARHRYRWFGRQDVCMLPRADLAPRFLDVEAERPSEVRP